jgi:uncharacterized protein YcaQ
MKSLPQSVYPVQAVRTVALHAQHLTAPLGASPTPDQIYDTIEQMMCVQIDTLQMVHRSHYLALWSRLGAYDPADLDRVAYGDGQSERRLFEYWLHAACLIPVREYRYRLPVMEWYRSNHGWRHEWTLEPENKALMKAVLKRIEQEGPLRTSDFEHTGKRAGSWWNWKPAKQALEHLFNQGRLMIAGRVNFQRVYDLRERVLPDGVDASEPTQAEMERYLIERSLKALGICEPAQAASCVHGFRRPHARALVQKLITSGIAVEVQSELCDGKLHTLVLHRDHLPALQQAADGALKAARTTFFSPFDNLFWAYGRDMLFWNFRQALEAYKPAGTWIYGYFTLPILHHDRFVGRFDVKMERQTGTLRLKALFLEPKVKPDDELVSDVAAALRNFMAFHQATALVIERSEPAAFGKKLLRAMK